MKRFLSLSMIVVCALLCCRTATAEIADKGYKAKRDELKSLYLVQSILGWYTRTNGERSIFQDSYKGHETLFSQKSIGYVDNIIKNRRLTDDDARMARFFRNNLILEYVSIDTAHFDDDVNNAEASATVKLDWVPQPVPYRQIDVMLDGEKDPDKRQKLQTAQAEVWRDTLNPILLKQEERVRALSRELGFRSVVDISQEIRWVDLKNLIAMSQDYIRENDKLYQDLFAQQVREVMGIEPDKFTRADIGFFSSVPAFKKFFPPELVLPSFMYFLSGMGLDLTTAGGEQIQIDDEPREKKVPRAACFSITVPDDIRITLKPSGGVGDFQTMFHEGGHALHFANTRTDVWEFQQLGNNAVTESYAGLFENVWGDATWLKAYRDLVRNFNRFQTPDKQVPLMTDAEIGRLVRNRAFWDFYFVRRYAGAKLIYESILHQGDPSLWAGYYSGDTKNLHKVYQTLFSDAYGFTLKDMEAQRYMTDVDSFFYSADYARSFILSAQLDEHLRGQYGAAWFADPRAGKFLREKIFAPGNKPQPDEIARIAGRSGGLDYTGLRKAITRRLAEADALIADGK